MPQSMIAFWGRLSSPVAERGQNFLFALEELAILLGGGLWELRGAGEWASRGLNVLRSAFGALVPGPSRTRTRTNAIP